MSVSSRVTSQHHQRHGTWVTAEYVLDDGTRHERVWFASPDADLQADLAANVASVEAEHAARLVREAEEAEAARRRDSLIGMLDAQAIADMLGISLEEAEAEKARVMEVSRG